MKSNLKQINIKSILLVSICCLFLFHSQAQQVFKNRLTGLGTQDVIVCNYLNGGYAFASFNNVNIQVFRTDAWGHIIWKKQIQTNYQLLKVSDIEATTDSGLIIVSYSLYVSLIIKLNYDGDTIWTKKYEYTSNYTCFQNIFELNSGNIIVIARLGGSKITMIKLTQNGDTIFAKSFSNGGGGYPPASIKTIKDNQQNFVIKPADQNWFLKLDSNANILWCNVCGVNWANQELTLASDGNYFLTSNQSGQTSIYIQKIDTAGIIGWTKCYNLFNNQAWFTYKTCSLNGGYLRILASNYDFSPPSLYKRYPFLVIINPIGNISYSNIIYDTILVSTGSSATFKIKDMISTNDGGFLAIHEDTSGFMDIKKFNQFLSPMCDNPYYLTLTPDTPVFSTGFAPPSALYIPIIVSSDTLTISIPNVQPQTLCSTISSAPNVWPGDCNFDFEANNLDFLYMNVALNDSGSARANASLNWIAQPASNWPNFFLNGANHKHADCDGNGVVDLNDTTAIIQNYSLTHPYKPAQQVYQAGLPDIKFVANVDTVFAGDSVSISLIIDSLSVPVDSLLGIAYSVLFDAMLIDTTSMSLSYDSSTLGIIHTDMESIQKPFYPNGKIDAAVCRTNHNDATNFGGLLGTFNFKINQSLPLISQLTISPYAATGISQSGVLKYFNLIADTIYIVDCNQPVQMNVSDSILCFGDSLFCNAVSNFPSQYEWLIDSNFISNNQSFAIDSLSDGNHLVSLNVSNGICNYTFSQNIFIDEPTQPQLILNGNVLTSTVNSNCQWFLNGQIIPGSNADTLVVQQTGFYKVLIKDINGCSAISDSLYLNPAGISNHNNNDFQIHPNPAQNYFTIELPGSTNSQIKIQMFSMDGKEFLIEKKTQSSRITIDSGKLSTGLYLVKIIHGNKIYFGKVSIMK